jgi:hypothetical protein
VWEQSAEEERPTWNSEDEVRGGRSKLLNEGLYNLFYSPNVIRLIKSWRMGWAGHVAHMDDIKNSYKILVGKPERKGPPERSKRRWEDDIRMDLKVIGCEQDLSAQDRDQWRFLVNTVRNVWVQ